MRPTNLKPSELSKYVNMKVRLYMTNDKDNKPRAPIEGVYIKALVAGNHPHHIGRLIILSTGRSGEPESINIDEVTDMILLDA